MEIFKPEDYMSSKALQKITRHFASKRIKKYSKTPQHITNYFYPIKRLMTSIKIYNK